MNKYLSQAFEERFTELRAQTAAQLTPENFVEQTAFVSRLREQLANASLTDLKKDLASGSHPPADWMEVKTDCLASLRALSLGERLPQRYGDHPPTGSFIEMLDEAKLDPERRFQLLVKRYSCPLNLALATERDIQEYILGRLMVQDRARIEKNSIAGLHSEDLLLRLNLLGVCASLIPDLRFLDALNYYYELWSAAHAPRARHSWLLASWLGLYARALAHWS